MTHPVFTAIPREEIVKRIRENVSVDISVTGVLGGEGRTLTVLVGQVSCGLLISAIGTATVINGVAHLTLNGVPADAETGLMFFLDTDGNGLCTEADTMWSGMLVTQQSNLSVPVDLSKLESSPNWMCFALEEAP